MAAVLTPQVGSVRGHTELPVPSGTFLCCPQGGMCSPPSPPEASREAWEEPLAQRDYDDVGSSSLGTLP